MRRARFYTLVGCLSLSFLSGISCSSSDLQPVQGQVLLNDQPLSGALVTFHRAEGADPKAMSSTGLTKEDGTFTIMTGDKPGVPPGNYVVTIICSEPVSNKSGQIYSTGAPETQDKLKGAYSNRDTSKITVEVKKGANKLDPFRLK